jgi:hypothetical protein
MRTAVALYCLAVLPAAQVSAQSALSGTYLGWDGPPNNGGATHLVNIYGEAIEINAPRGDTCGRLFYFQGVISLLSAQGTATLSGHMVRCTNPELLPPPCSHPNNYQTAVEGTARLDPATRTLTLNLTYRMEFYNKDNCEKDDREEPRSEVLQLVYQAPPPPTPSPPTVRQRLGDHFRRGVQSVVDFSQGLGLHDLLAD